MKTQTRRSFIKSLAIIGAAPMAFAASQRGKPFEIPSAVAQTDPTTPVDPASPIAVALGYNPDTAKVDDSKFPTHSAAKHCSICQLYTKGGIKVDGQPGEFGVCQIFAGGLVSANGWCQSFVAKV